MQSFRHAARAVGPRARTLLPITSTSAATRRCFSVTTLLKKTDSKASGADVKVLPDTIWSPWRISDLGWEAKLYEQYGPNYIDHVDAKKQELIRQRAATRRRIEEELKAELGDDSNAWYEIMWEANKRQRRFSSSVVDEFRRRKRELGPYPKGNKSPEHQRLEEEMRTWSTTGQREKNLEFRRQLVEERRRQS